MTHINTNQHRSHVVHDRWELQVKQVSLDLGVDLSKDVRCLGHVEFVGILSANNLRWDLELMEQLLVHLVVVFVAKDHNYDLRVPEYACRRSHHVGEQL